MEDSKETIYLTNCPVCGNNELVPFLSCKDHFATQETFSIYKCHNCGFALTQGSPAEENIGRYYDVPAYISHSDTDKGFVNRFYHWARRVALKSKSKIISRYAARQQGMLLDIGCGTGYFLNRMKELKWIVTGIEKAEGARTYAKEKFDLDCQDPDYLYQIPPKSKDVITMWHVLEHVQHLDKVMNSLHHVLKDDGVVVIALPNKDSFDAVSYGADWAAYDVPRHLWHFSPSNFKMLADKYAFDLVATKMMYFDAFYISILSEKNKGTSFASLVGLLKGVIFFLRTLADKNRSSSLIYILKKKKH